MNEAKVELLSASDFRMLTELEKYVLYRDAVARPEPFVDCVVCGRALGLSNIRCATCDKTRPPSPSLAKVEAGMPKRENVPTYADRERALEENDIDQFESWLIEAYLDLEALESHATQQAAELAELKGKFTEGLGDGSDKSQDIAWLRGGFLKRGAEIDALEDKIAQQAEKVKGLLEVMQRILNYPLPTDEAGYAEVGRTALHILKETLKKEKAMTTPKQKDSAAKERE